MFQRPFRTAAALVAALTITVGVTPDSASAGSSYMSRSNGTSVFAYWTQVDGTAVGSGPFGNVHVGFLDAFQTTRGKADVFTYIDDFDCQPGKLPGGHGGVVIDDAAGDEEPPPDDGCAYLGSRIGQGYGLRFTIDRKLDAASLQGRLTMTQGGHDGPGDVVGNPRVDMTWTGVGNVSSYRSNYRYQEGGTTYSGSSSGTWRSATLGGILGPMSFDPNLSSGSLGTFRDFSKSRTR